MTLTRLGFDAPWVRPYLTAAQRVVLVKRAASLGAERLNFGARTRTGPFMAALSGGRFDPYTDRAWALSPFEAAEKLFAIVDGWPETVWRQAQVNPYHSHWNPNPARFLVESSEGPFIPETRLEALQRRVHSAAAHPLRSCVRGHCVLRPGHGGRHRFVVGVAK